MRVHTEDLVNRDAIAGFFSQLTAHRDLRFFPCFQTTARHRPRGTPSARPMGEKDLPVAVLHNGVGGNSKIHICHTTRPRGRTSGGGAILVQPKTPTYNSNMGGQGWIDAAVAYGGLLLVIVLGFIPLANRAERRRRTMRRNVAEGVGDAMGVVDEVFNPGARHARFERDIKRELQVPITDARKLDDLDDGRITLELDRRDDDSTR